jgi:hypothetical protein
MVQTASGEDITHAEARELWASAAYDKLKSVASRYNDVISYKQLALYVQDATGVNTNQLITNWIGMMLERVAQRAADAEEPPLTSLCVYADGTIGPGYGRAPKFAPVSKTSDIELVAAEHRLLCYRRFATDLPADGGVPTLTPMVTMSRRSDLARSDSPHWLSELIAAGRLTVGDKIPFKTHVEVAQLFGRDFAGHQQATIGLGDRVDVWFPKLYSNNDWENSLSNDGQLLTMRQVLGGKYSSVMAEPTARGDLITFGHIRATRGSPHYEFVGVFRRDPSASSAEQWVHRRISDSVEFDGIGGFAYRKEGARPVNDDQIAEVDAYDPELVQELEAQQQSGNYRVEDQQGSSRVRGSAQRVFAKAVKANYDWECAITGIRTSEFLVASHIVPWSADKDIRTDPTNGICLSTFVDRAFDAGFLEIRPNGRTAVRWERVHNDPILKIELGKIDDVAIAKPKASPPDPLKLARRIELDHSA